MSHPTTLVFLEQEYSYRNAWVGLFLAIFGGGTGLMLFGLIVKLQAFPAEFAAGKVAWGEPLVTLLFASPFAALAGYAAWLFFVRPRWLVRIDDRGITFGHQFFGWEKIGQIGVQSSGHFLYWQFGYYPCFHLRSRWPLALHRGLPLSPTLTTEQAEELLDRLEEFLHNNFPQVEVG